jgi:hypothetical protein
MKRSMNDESGLRCSQMESMEDNRTPPAAENVNNTRLIIGNDDESISSPGVATYGSYLRPRKRRIEFEDDVNDKGGFKVRRGNEEGASSMTTGHYSSALDLVVSHRHRRQDSNPPDSFSAVSLTSFPSHHGPLQDRIQSDMNQQMADVLRQQFPPPIQMVQPSSRPLFDNLYGMPDDTAARNLMGQQSSGTPSMLRQDPIFGAGNYSGPVGAYLGHQPGMVGDGLLDRLSGYPTAMISSSIDSMATQFVAVAQQNAHLARSLAATGQTQDQFSAQLLSTLRMGGITMNALNSNLDYSFTGSPQTPGSAFLLPGLASLSEQRRRLMSYLDVNSNQLNIDALPQAMIHSFPSQNGFDPDCARFPISLSLQTPGPDNQSLIGQHHTPEPSALLGGFHDQDRLSSMSGFTNSSTNTTYDNLAYSREVLPRPPKPNRPPEGILLRVDSKFPLYEGAVPHYRWRVIVPLATDEDENWLSDFMCFIRSHLVEVFRASTDDVASRINSKKVSYGQIGVRCRFCAHLPSSEKASRSACYPSSLSRIYQSLTMMIRDHFINCNATPVETREKFIGLKSKATQGASDSKRYWVESAITLGLKDKADQKGIVVLTHDCHNACSDDGDQSNGNEHLPAAAASKRSPERIAEPRDPPHAIFPGVVSTETTGLLLVTPEDKDLVSDYLYTLMQQVERVSLTESERVGNRKTMALGLPGFGCRHCLPSNRKGMCRFFPARRRTLPAKMSDLHTHLGRCSLCPTNVKAQLSMLRERQQGDGSNNCENQKSFFDRIWARLRLKSGEHQQEQNHMACPSGGEDDEDDDEYELT